MVVDLEDLTLKRSLENNVDGAGKEAGHVIGWLSVDIRIVWSQSKLMIHFIQVKKLFVFNAILLYNRLSLALNKEGL